MKTTMKNGCIRRKDRQGKCIRRRAIEDIPGKNISNVQVQEEEYNCAERKESSSFLSMNPTK
jgi:hypothetical protein